MNLAAILCHIRGHVWRRLCRAEKRKHGGAHKICDWCETLREIKSRKPKSPAEIPEWLKKQDT